MGEQVVEGWSALGSALGRERVGLGVGMDWLRCWLGDACA